MPEERWCDMSKRAKLALVAENLPAEKRQAVMARVEKHFRGARADALDDPNDVFNVVLRETWRHDHGEVESWDRAARAGGVVIP